MNSICPPIHEMRQWYLGVIMAQRGIWPLYTDEQLRKFVDDEPDSVIEEIWMETNLPGIKSADEEEKRLSALYP
jgi:hypothetical protein